MTCDKNFDKAGVSPVKQEQITRAEIFDQFQGYGPLARVMRTPHQIEGDFEQDIEKRTGEELWIMGAMGNAELLS